MPVPLPNARLALVAVEKIRDYLLSPTHQVGRFKAGFFTGLGFTRERWQQLEQQIRDQALTGEIADTSASEYGLKYVIRGELRGPSGRTAQIVSVWIVRQDEATPRFVTAYPGER